MNDLNDKKLMKRKYIYPILVILVTIIFYYAEDYVSIGASPSETTNKKKDSTTDFLYLPTSTTDMVIRHNHYSLSYSEKHEQPEWVAYHLTKEDLSDNDFKRPYFEIDKKIPTGAADWRNYKGSGYDKGHLCPAADRRFVYKAFEETFLTSNISPQDHDFNAGIWNQLEQKIRYWARTYGDVYVVTGGILTDDLSYIGYEAVSVPNYFYKVVFHNHPTQPKIIAFIIPNKDTPKPLDHFIVSTDEIEKRTGIDFFPVLDDALESTLEASTSKKGWKL